jgi:undecaprenyl-diphosphatase
MDILQAITLGAVQGLGEFLPISSSAHLILTPWLFGWKDQGLSFDVALHWGTLLAVLYYFRQDWWLLLKGFWHSLFKSTRDLENNIYQKLPYLLLLASVPGALIGYLLESQAEDAFRNPVLVAANLAVFGVIILAADSLGKKQKNLDRVKWLDALWVGLSQALAIVPGVSRSGSTMAAGLLLGFKRSDAARFSFLMSAPIILGAGLVNLGEMSHQALTMQFWAGFFSAALFGFFAIKYLLRYLASHGFKIFVWYRLGLAALILLLHFANM